MQKLIIGLPGNEHTAAAISAKNGIPLGKAEMRRFPDGECYTRFYEGLKGKSVYLVCTLFRPDELILPLYFAASGARRAGAEKVILVAPYLCYLRQDKVFLEGEILSAKLFAELLSSFLDGLITIDPHLHRYKSLSEVYSIPTLVIQSTENIASWIRANVRKPLIIGPDSESEQWAATLSAKLRAPYLVLQKKRLGDRSVEIEIPQVKNYSDFTPVLLDDIISTGKTMAETVKHLSACGMLPPICIAVHAVFAQGAYEELMAAGAKEIVSCNTIPHHSNKIDVTGLLAAAELP